MTDATDKEYGSEGFCPHCKHHKYCIGSTKNHGTSRQHMCYGSETWWVACSTGDLSVDSVLFKDYPKTISYGYKFEER